MPTTGYIAITSTEILLLENIKWVSIIGTSLQFVFVDGSNKTYSYTSVDEAQSKLDEVKAAIIVYPIMQSMYGTSDTPTSDPVDVNMPASYRGRTHNTFYMWDTAAHIWYSIISI